ncbi:MAG: hypothetical protein AVDCRST_MAG53-1543, partial [uncultured Solirubrobacteraceae bacterium]
CLSLAPSPPGAPLQAPSPPPSGPCSSRSTGASSVCPTTTASCSARPSPADAGRCRSAGRCMRPTGRSSGPCTRTSPRASRCRRGRGGRRWGWPSTPPPGRPRRWCPRSTRQARTSRSCGAPAGRSPRPPGATGCSEWCSASWSGGSTPSSNRRFPPTRPSCPRTAAGRSSMRRWSAWRSPTP